MPFFPHLKQFIPFTSDYGFKVTFGNEHNTLFLRRALQAILELESPIEELFFEKNTKEPPTKKGRHLIYDLTCRLQTGEIVIIEMQLANFPFMLNRLKYYTAIRMIPFVKKGKFSFGQIPRIYAIGILGKNLFSDEDYFRKVCLYDDKQRLIDNQTTYILIELEKFSKTSEICFTDLDKLLYIMKSFSQTKEITPLPDFVTEEWLSTAIRELYAGTLPPDERAFLEAELARTIFDDEMLMEYAEHRHDEGLKEGIREGKIEGKIEGIKEGIITTIRKLINKNPDWSDEYIAELMDVPLEQVRKLRTEMQ